MNAYQKIAAWRKYIERAAIECGAVKPHGRQGEGYENYLPSAALAMSRVGECQVYQGSKLPVPPVYLTVEVAIAQIDKSDSFRRFVYRDLKSARSFGRKLSGTNMEAGRLLVSALSQPDMIHEN